VSFPRFQELEAAVSHDDVSYYEERAETEIQLAQQASHQRVVQAHYDLANAYLDRIHGDNPTKAPGPIA
jgi:hypothetical protein